MTDHSSVEQFVHQGDVTHHFVDGEHVSVAVKNVFGGQDYYDNSNHLLVRSLADAEHGHELVDGAGKLVGHTHPNEDHGEDFIAADGKLLAHTSANVHGGQDVRDGYGTLHASTMPVGHDFVQVMHHSDPLLHCEGFYLPKLDLNS